MLSNRLAFAALAVACIAAAAAGGYFASHPTQTTAAQSAAAAPGQAESQRDRHRLTATDAQLAPHL